METIKIQIPNELFAPAESTHFDGTLDLPVFKSGPDLYTFPEPLRWDVDITNTGDAFLVSGTVEGTAETACARCLEPVKIPLIGEIEGYYLISEEGQAPEDLDEDEFEVLPADHILDITPLIQAALLLEVPLVPLCEEECKGLCPECGGNRNKGECTCAPHDEAVNPSSDNPFAVLKNYDFGS